ncbi:hypothetical protein [Streptomyces sp. NPDC048710]|uniref:hypothetical protein n=1 Tax=unclassified Streptomyces TaxID=2593676 RepID=UPI00371E3872
MSNITVTVGAASTRAYIEELLLSGSSPVLDAKKAAGISRGITTHQLRHDAGGAHIAS